MDTSILTSTCRTRGRLTFSPDGSFELTVPTVFTRPFLDMAMLGMTAVPLEPAATTRLSAVCVCISTILGVRRRDTWHRIYPRPLAETPWGKILSESSCRRLWGFVTGGAWAPLKQTVVGPDGAKYNIPEEQWLSGGFQG